jgi:hypothetical protein
MMKKLITSLALFSLSTIALATSLTSLTSTQAKSAISGKTITTVSKATMNGQLVDNSFTGYFNTDGTMQGKFANPLSDGMPQTDKGTWKVQSNGQVCVTWQNWENATQRCMTFYKLTNALLIIGPNNKFETLVLDSDIQSGNQLSS